MVTAASFPDGYGGVEWWGMSAPARHDPGRVLRDVKVKRQIIDACDRILCLEHPDGYEADILAESTLRLLAAGYDTEPGYQEAWRP